MTDKKINLTTNLYNEQGEKIGDFTLPEIIFGAKINTPLMAQAVRVYLANQRRGTASTKTRGEVRGGGRKPWKQKGTGRARQGSIRSPLWIKGGVVHGPEPKDWSLKMSKKMKRLALFSALSEKQSQQKVKVIESLKFEKPSAKTASNLLKKMECDNKVLVVLPEKNDSHYLSFRNIENIEIDTANVINTYQVLNAKEIIIVKKALDTMQATFLTEKKTAKKE